MEENSNLTNGWRKFIWHSRVVQDGPCRYPTIQFVSEQKDFNGCVHQICTFLFRQFSCLKTSIEQRYVSFSSFTYRKICISAKVKRVLLCFIWDSHLYFSSICFSNNTNSTNTKSKSNSSLKSRFMQNHKSLINDHPCL